MKKSFLILWTAIAGLLLFCWVYLPSLSKYRDLKMKQDELEHQLKELEKKLTDIREERDLLKNDVEYLEKVIRGELGLVKPGEIVYKFVQEQQEAANQLAQKASQTVFVLPSPSPVSGTVTQVAAAASSKPVPVIQPLPAAPPGFQSAASAPTAGAASLSGTSAGPGSSASGASAPVYPRQETR